MGSEWAWLLMSVLSTVITLWDFAVALFPAVGWMVVVWLMWRCSRAEEPMASFRRWLSTMVIVAGVSTAEGMWVRRDWAQAEEHEMRRSARDAMKQIELAVDSYYWARGEWPAGGNREVMATLLKGREDGGGGYLNRGNVRLGADGSALDPWRRPYLMEVRGEKMRVWSAGKDGVSGTGDDVF
ncbi:type II secretion system protein GspG [Luteolibacter soli]|uniref:Type II secretion system protein GspG n=1 Tax=Luteolibacter soli TaxID=3135280 RepID=A0ABU9AXB0_9BACT